MEALDLFPVNDSPALTLFSIGGGQDSSVLLEMCLDDASFRAKYAPNDILFIMSDIGDELPETYRHVEYMRSRCDEAGLPFIFLTPDMGYHSPTWRTLRGFYRAKDTLGSPAFPAVCSIRLKIDPIYRFLEAWLSEKYGVQRGSKKGIRQFAATSGKIRVVLGIAKGEESRVTDPGNSPKRWYRESIEHVYPLLDLGMDRADCQAFLHARGLRVMPSNCMACHYASLPEIEFLRRFHPESLQDWANLESAKLEKHKDRSAIIVTDAEEIRSTARMVK